MGGVQLSAKGRAAVAEPSAGKPSRLFFRIRVGILLTILVGLILFAWGDARSRAARNDWSRTLDVAIVLVETGPTGSIDGDVEARLRDRADTLASTLDEEMRRYRDGSPPFSFQIFPVQAEGLHPPPPPDDEGIVAAARYTWELHRFTSHLDDVAGLAEKRFDSRIYLLASPIANARRKSVEGLSQEGGRVGLVEVELDASMVDFALFVVAHELLHTLGAVDTYDASGEPRAPEGLADPERVPLYPQDAAEVMARHRAIAVGRSVPPERLDELRVGASTARAIGWLRSQ